MIAVNNPLSEPRRGWTQGEKILGMAILCLGYVALDLFGGSGWLFASLVGVYVATTLFAIWCNGGIKTVFGFAVFYQAFQTVLVSQIARVALGKNPESRLDAAIPTILCEILVTLGYALAGLIASRIRINRDRPLFPPITDLVLLQRLAVAGTFLSVIRILATAVLHQGSGPLHVLGAYDPIAVGSAVGCAVIQSGGRRLFNPLALYVIAPIVFFSLIGGGRAGLLQSAQSVVIAAWMFGYRFRFYQYILAVVGLLTMVFIISPFSLLSRTQNRGGDMVQNLNSSIDSFNKVIADPLKYQFDDAKTQSGTAAIFRLQDYYELPTGNAGNILNRFGLIRVQDMLISDALKNGTTGFANITPAFDYVLPSVLAPNKGFQIWANGNALAHRIQGLVNEGDRVTGIVTGIPPDAFGAFGWVGSLLLPFGGLLWLILVQKLLVTLDMRENVFGIATGLLFAFHITEGTVSTFIQGPIYDSMLLFVAFYTVTRLSRLLDFGYLRPKSPPKPWADGETGVIL